MHVDYMWLNNGYVAGIGIHIHEMGLSDAYDVTLPENAPFGYKDAMWDFEDSDNFYTDIKVPLIDDKGWYDTEEHRELGDITLEHDCVSFGTHGQNIGYGTEEPGDEFAIYEEASWVEFPAGFWKLHGDDSYGDGWWDYSDYSWIDIYEDGVLVVDFFTVSGSSNDLLFELTPGAFIELDYIVEQGLWEDEHSWYLAAPDGTIILSGGGSGPEYHTFTAAAYDIDPENVGRGTLWPPEPIDETIVWETEIQDSYEAYLDCGTWSYHGETPTADLKGAIITFELSADGGDNWYVINKVDSTIFDVPPVTDVPVYDPDGDDIGNQFDISPWAGNSLLIRLRVQNIGVDLWTPNTQSLSYRMYYEGFVSIKDVHISCKQDMLPPSATVSLSGNNVGPGLYAGPVTVKITAVDDMKMGEIHYTLDGSETVVSGSTASFTVNSDGDHTVTFYPVDATGNVGSSGSVSFAIDNSPPTVAITAPEPGLYLFGNKLLSMAKPIIIGAFTAEATADDGEGIAVVQFMLNGEVVGEDTEAPFDAYIAVKNMGAGTLKVVAIDGVGNTAEDSMDITYYKFL